jgi:hypothetical protein
MHQGKDGLGAILFYEVLAIGIIVHLSNGFAFFSDGLSHY